MTARKSCRIVRCCEVCRADHAKCDDQLPSCGRCTLLRRQCNRGLAFPFRCSNNATSLDLDSGGAGEFDFADDQVWVTPSIRNVEFVFEYHSINNSSLGSDVPLATPSSHTLSGQSPNELPHSPLSVHNGTLQASLQDYPREAAASASPPLISSHPSQPSPSTNLYTTNSWPLSDRHEALLMRHFVADLSQWFDYCDKKKTFAGEVAQCAAVSAPLRYAILAVSARHLSLTKGHEAYIADWYHRQCLALLIPILDQSCAALDEALFAATVILRLFEEISTPLAGRDFQSHFKGTHTFARAQRHPPPSEGIRQAVLCVALRQEIVIAFRTQKPVELLPEYIQLDQSFKNEDDWALAWHIIVLCAEILNYCYGDDVKSPDAWNEMKERARSWMDTKPIRFEPLMYRASGEAPKDRFFPEIWLLNDCHVAAHQYYLICQILLIAHDPKRPQLGPGCAKATEVANDTIRGHVRSICGIALSNGHCIPAMFTASMVIGITGDLFDDRGERMALMDILVRTDKELAWPTTSIQNYLRRELGWDC